MTSKDRVLSALTRNKGDRLPFHIMGFYEKESQEKIQNHLGVDDLGKVYEELGIDVRGAGGGNWSKAPERLDEEGNNLGLWGGGGFPYTAGMVTPKVKTKNWQN